MTQFEKFLRVSFLGMVSTNQDFCNEDWCIREHAVLNLILYISKMIKAPFLMLCVLLCSL